MDSKQLKQIRTEAEMTQAEYAQYIGVSLRTYVEYEAGRTKIPKTVCKLIDAYSRLESLLIQMHAQKKY